jgi:hypothetical protein
MILDNGDGRPTGSGAYDKPISGPDPHRGTVYVVAGSSGMSSTSGSMDHPAMFFSLEALGSMVIDVDDNRLDATFLQSTGAVRDTFTITKGTSNAGFLSPTADEPVSSDGDDDGFGSNSTNAYADDGSFAVDSNSGSGTSTSCSGSSKDKHLFYNYSLTIPSGATVEGIEVLLDARVDSTSGSPKLCAWLSWDGGSSWTSSKSTPTLSTSEEHYILGGPTIAWSRSWTAANFSNANFRVRVASVASSTSRDFSLDWVGVKVTTSGGSGGGVPTPDIAVTPTSYDYGAQLIGTSVTHGFAVSNTGTDDLVVGAVTMSGPNTQAFDLVSGQDGFTIAPGGSELIEVRFGPSTTGPKTVTLTIPSDDPDEDPVLVTLTGTGTNDGGTGGGTASPTLEEVREGGAGGTSSATTATNVTGVAGHLYLAAVSTRPHREVDAVDGLGLSWTRMVAQCAGRDQTGIELWWAQGTATTGTVRATLASAATNVLIVVARYSGVASANPVAALVAGNTNGADGACSGGTDSNDYSFDVTTAQDNALVVGAVTMRTRTHTPGPGYTERSEAAQGTTGDMTTIALVDRLVSNATSLPLNGTLSGDVDWAVIGVALHSGTPTPVPDIDGVPSTHAYGDVAVGGNASQTFAISNVGTDDLQLSETSLAGGDAGQFSITQGSAPATVAPGAIHNLVVRFAPTSGGTKAATLRLTSDDPDESPLDVALGGVGTTSPDISVAPTSHNYGSVTVGSSVTRTFAVTNTGTGNLVVTASALTGANAAEFAIVNGQSGFTVAPGATSPIEVRFSPSTQGPKSATLSIPSNDANENPWLIALTGAGTSGGGGSTTPTFEEAKEGGSADSNTVTTTMNLLGANGDVYLAAVSSKPYSAVNTMTGLGLAWTRLVSQCAGRNQTGVDVWWAQGAATTGSVTATLESAPGNAAISVARYSNVAATDPVALLVTGNTNGVNGECSGGTDSASYSFNVTTSDSNAVVLGAVAMRTKSHTPGSGYTERIETAQGTGADTASLALMDRAVPAVTSLPLNGTLSDGVDWAVVGIELRHAAEPAPDIDGIPPTHAYGDVSVGASVIQTFVVRNVGNADLGVSGTSLVGGDSTQFAITQGAAPFTVAPGATRNLDVRFAPTSGGSKATTLRLASDDPDESSMDVALSGNGVTTPDIAVTPTSHDFGNVSVGANQARSFTVSNTGTGNLVVNASALTGTDSAAFAIVSGQSGFTLVPGATSVIDVRFSPLNEGPKSASLSIPSTDPDENPLLVSLDGTGVPSTPPTFEEVREGASLDSTTITVTNMTAVAGHLYLAAVSTRYNVAVSTMAGLGLTWTRVAAQCAGRDQTGIELWWAQGNATSGTVTATLESTAATAVMTVARYSGAATANPVALLITGNTNGINGACAGGSDTSTYSFNVTTTQANAVVFGAVATRTRTNSPGSGYSERIDATNGSGGETVRISIMDRAVPASTSLPLNGTLNGTSDWAVIGVQVKP